MNKKFSTLVAALFAAGALVLRKQSAAPRRGEGQDFSYPPLPYGAAS